MDEDEFRGLEVKRFRLAAKCQQLDGPESRRSVDVWCGRFPEDLRD